MKPLLGYSLGALSPWFLLGVPAAIALLVYVYRVRGTLREVVVSSLFLVRQLPQRVTARKKFVPPLQFWIELTALSLLSLAAASLFISDSRKRIAVVVDSSLSMNTRAASGGSLFDNATRIASADVAAQLGQASFSVYGASSTLTNVSERNVSATAAAVALRAMRPSLEPDNLDAALRSLAADGSFDAVWLYTDKAVPDGASRAAIKVTTIPTDPSQLRNVWIRSARRSTSGIDVELSSVGKDLAAVQVAASCFDETGGPVAAPLPSTAKLPPGQQLAVKISVTPPTWAYCKVTVQDAAQQGDALAVDNEAWVVNGASSIPVQVVSPLREQELGLQRLVNFSFTRFSSSDDPSFNPNAAAIFHRSPVPKGLHAPSLAVFPPPGQLPWGGASATGEVTAVTATRWDSAHPVLRYLNPTLLLIPRARAITCADTAVPVLSSTGGTLACAGDSDGNRYLVSAFELFPFDGSSSPTVSIFTLNTLRWLFAEQGSTSSSSASLGTYRLPAGAKDVRYLAPNVSAPEPSKGGAIAVSTPGVVAVTSPRSPKAELKAFNLFSDQESDLSQVEYLDLPPALSSLGSANRSPLLLAPWLALVALAVLLLDVVRKVAGKHSWGGK